MPSITRVTEINTVVTFLSLFMVLFMLASCFIIERIFIGPAPLAFITGILFGPKSISLVDPLKWHNHQTFTREFSRIVLAIQCFGNAIDLPKSYLYRHWKSIGYVVGPVLTIGWLITTCCMKVMVPTFTWKQSLACAACFNAIDPVLAGTVLDYSFAKRVPKHLRDLLRAEAAANGLVAGVLLGLATYLLQYPSNLGRVAIKAVSISLCYESLFGAVAGVILGYMARRAVRLAWNGESIDRPCLIAFYLMTATLSAGFGAVIGVDEVNLAFFAGVGLDNDNWYELITAGTFLASCIDLMLNLIYFVYLGTLIPWQAFSRDQLDTPVWRLVTGVLCIFLFRRLPVVLSFKTLVCDIKTWREALFYGHFGPIGAGAVFSALTVRGRLAPGSFDRVNVQAEDAEVQRFLDQLWAVVTLVVLCSSILHGTSIAIFTLGKKGKTLSIILPYTLGSETTPNWIDRLLRIVANKISGQPPGSEDDGRSTGGVLDLVHAAASINLSSDSYTTPDTLVHAHSTQPFATAQDETDPFVKNYPWPKRQHIQGASPSSIEQASITTGSGRSQFQISQVFRAHQASEPHGKQSDHILYTVQEQSSSLQNQCARDEAESETEVERGQRLRALGLIKEESDDSDENDGDGFLCRKVEKAKNQMTRITWMVD